MADLVRSQAPVLPETGRSRTQAEANTSDAGEAARLARADVEIADIMKAVDNSGRFTTIVSAQGTQAWNPDLWAKNVARAGAAMHASGLALFAAEQLGLFLLNKHGKVWNPASFVAPPFAENFLPAAVDVLTGTPRLLTGFDDSLGGTGLDFYSRNHSPQSSPLPGQDFHYDMAKGQHSEVRMVHYPPFIETVLFGGKVGEVSTGIQLHAPSQADSLLPDPSLSDLGRPLLDAALDARNRYTPANTFDQNAYAMTDDLVAEALGGPMTGHQVKEVGADVLRYTYDRQTAQAGASTSISRFVGPSRASLIGEQRPDPAELAVFGNRPVASRALAKSAFAGKGTRGLIPARFPGENDFGYVVTKEGQSPQSVVPDDVAYMPLWFTDLRPIERQYRTVMFRALNVKVAESFSQSWNKGQYYGRVDPAATYESTTRAVTLSFLVAAFSPEDMKVIYQKMHWLTSMVYPEYDKDLLFVSGPVCRLRVGDLISALGPEGGRGLPGIIENLSFDYGENRWELANGMRVPQGYDVSLNFTVIHDKPVGRGAQGRFGGIGTHRDGVYIPPGQDKSSGAGSADQRRLAEVERSDGTVRALDRTLVPMNDYASFEKPTTDGPGKDKS